MNDVHVTELDNGKVALISPYNPAMPPAARAIGGRWDAASKAWTFDARDLERVRDLARSIYGTDGDLAQGGDLVTVRVPLYRCEDTGGVARFAGRRIANRPYRDSNVILADGVVVVAGTLYGRGGSVKNPRIDADTDVVVEIRDLPRAALAVESADVYQIIDEQLDLDALLAERERLLARIAEIDTLLPEPEGAELSSRQAATALGVSLRTVQRWAQQGKVQAAKVAGHWIITVTVTEA